MTFIVTRLCRDRVDLSCVRVCPVDCILEHHPRPGEAALPNQVYVDPDLCIDCGLCEPECPWEAIYHEDEVPTRFEEDVKLNAIIADRRDRFRSPCDDVENETPSPADVEANKKRWGFI